MIKEIKYNGFTETPSDYECPDGDLAGLISLVPEDETIKPIFPPAELFTLPVGYSVAFIHVNSGYKHYIVRHDGTLYWFDNAIIESAGVLPVNVGTDKLTPLHNFTNDIYEVNAIGNTLVVLTSTGMHYILWKGEDTGYLYLGTHLPELPISFGLQGEMIRGEEFEITFDNIGFFSGDVWKDFTDDNKTKITNQVLAKANKFIAENSTNAGKFMFPFLVRYAYRLYDQSLVMHSAPVLMVCSSDLAPQCFVTNMHGHDTSTEINSAKLRLCSMFHQLDYAVINSSYINALGNWKDIVKSVDIFISKPIYTYDQNGECTSFVYTDYSDCYCVCKHTNQAADTSKYPLRYQKATLAWLYAKTFDPTELKRPSWRLMLPARDGEAVKADIADNQLFYLLKSINIDDLKTTRTIVPINKEYLQSLVNRESMTDDYDSHDTLIPQYSFAYNQRLNVANMKKILFDGFNAASLFTYTDGYVANFSDADPTIIDYTGVASVFFFIRQDGKEIVVHGGTASFGMRTPFLFLFHPNANAYKAVIAFGSYLLDYYEVPLEPHPTLNGAYYFEDWEGAATSQHQIHNVPSVSSVAQRTIDLPNKIYTSEVNNPFYFPSLGINTVGTGTILGICSAVRALSQGQFGQFPLYAFTTEGVWALEVSSEGKYTARQPVTRDVCINSDSITQIDTAVLFVTDRGIMLISGSNSQCISDTINSQSTFSIDTLPNLRSVLGNELADEMEYIPFREYIQDCRMLYDYTHQRIIVYNPSQTYAYVYSLKSKQWGMMSSDIQSSLNSYPDALALLQTNEETYTIVNYSEEDSATEAVRGILVTRPLKLDAPDVLKTVDTIIQRGYFRKGNVKTILYASRDLFNWQYVYSSADHYLRGFRGTPYKYFRIALICDMQKDESIFGCTVQFTPRLANQPR